MLKIYLLLLIGIFTFGQALSQNEAIDSLQKAITETSDSKKLTALYIDLAEEALGISVDSSIAIIDTAIQMAIAISDEELLGEALIWQGRVLGEANNLEAAFNSFEKAEKIFSNPTDSLSLAKIYNGKGILYKYENDLQKAIELQYKSAGIYEKLDLHEKAATTYNSIANLHVRLDDDRAAIPFYEKAIESLEKTDNERALAGVLLNLSGILVGEPERKLGYLKRVEKICIKNNYNRLGGYLYSNWAEYYESAEVNVDSQLVYYTKAIEAATRANDPYMISFNNLYLGIIQSSSNPVQSEKHIRTSLESDYIQNDHTLKADAHVHLSKSLYKQKKFAEAYRMLDTAKFYFEELHAKDVTRISSEASEKYQAEKKDAEIAKQELEISRKDNQRNIVIGSSLFGLLLLSGIFYFNFQRQKLKKKETELALLDKQKEAEKLKELDEMKTHFFTNVSHELRTPLTLILGPLSDAMEKVDNVEVKKSIHLAHSNADRLNEMINEVLDLSKLESGHIKLETAALELQPFLKRVLFAFESMAEMRNVRLELSGNIAGEVISTDADKLEKILNNLISNAIKYSPNNSRILLKANLEEGILKIEVQDNGKGIHPDEREKIFNRFYQSNIITAVEGGGTGVGLALSRELAELFGGTLNVESELQQGSNFILTMPVKILEQRSDNGVSRDETIKETQAYVPILINGKKPHMLIIEDNEEMRDYLHSLLAEEYRCSFANDGYAALQMLQKNNYDIISSDIMMPLMDGFELKEKVNQLSGLKHTPFIFLTARSLEEDKIEGLRLGVDDYISKPFSKYEYRARINNLLKNKIEREQWLNQNSEDAMQNVNIEEDILKKAETSILTNIADPAFKVNNLAADLNYSQRQLTRIIKKLTGLTPVNFILELRLQKAHQLLKSKSFHTVNEVRFEVGIESASYFARKFKERYGISPGEV